MKNEELTLKRRKQYHDKKNSREGKTATFAKKV